MLLYEEDGARLSLLPFKNTQGDFVGFLFVLTSVLSIMTSHNSSCNEREFMLQYLKTDL